MYVEKLVFHKKVFYGYFKNHCFLSRGCDSGVERIPEHIHVVIFVSPRVDSLCSLC